MAAQQFLLFGLARYWVAHDPIRPKCQAYSYCRNYFEPPCLAEKRTPGRHAAVAADDSAGAVAVERVSVTPAPSAAAVEPPVQPPVKHYVMKQAWHYAEPPAHVVHLCRT